MVYPLRDKRIRFKKDYNFFNFTLDLWDVELQVRAAQPVQGLQSWCITLFQLREEQANFYSPSPFCFCAFLKLPYVCFYSCSSPPCSQQLFQPVSLLMFGVNLANKVQMSACEVQSSFSLPCCQRGLSPHTLRAACTYPSTFGTQEDIASTFLTGQQGVCAQWMKPTKMLRNDIASPLYIRSITSESLL